MPNYFDLLIRNGTLIDGTGSPRRNADVAVSDGVIVEVGTLPPEVTATEVIDAAGQVVAPGFIDIHTHADIALLARPQHLPKIMQGVTTEVFTNCGLGFAPVSTPDALATQKQYLSGLFGPDEGVDWQWRSVAEFLSRFEQGGIGTNIAYLIPHGAVRVSAMGMAERPADADELRTMQALMAQGMDEGAWGMSTGIWYAPMRAADRNEMVTLCRTAGFFATHQRDYGDQLWAATEESLAIAREAGVPVQISHLQMNGPGNANRADDLLELLESARASGVDVTCDTYPYTAGSTFVQSLLPAWAADGGPERILERLADAETRRRIVEEVGRSRADWQAYTLVGATSAANRPFEGQPFDRIAEVRHLPVAEWVCAVLEEDELRACYVHHAAHEGNVRTILQWDGQMVGSDGLHLPGATHPRLYGTFPRVLGHYAREQKVVSLEAAIHKMTGLPAARLGLPKRGTIQPGHAADIVLFDPGAIADVATFDDPLRYPLGIPDVWVNGVAVKRAGQPTNALPGQVLRRSG